MTLHMAHLDDPDLLGLYAPEEARIYIRFGLTQAEQRSVIAHELGHAYHGHECDSAAHEREAWAYAADILVDPAEYARLEREGMCGHDIADELQVTAAVIDAWREHHAQRLGRITYGRRNRGRFTNTLARRLA